MLTYRTERKQTHENSCFYLFSKVCTQIPTRSQSPLPFIATIVFCFQLKLLLYVMTNSGQHFVCTGCVTQISGKILSWSMHDMKLTFRTGSNCTNGASVKDFQIIRGIFGTQTSSRTCIVTIIYSEVLHLWQNLLIMKDTSSQISIVSIVVTKYLLGSLPWCYRLL
jgi:hypothetical protein